MGNATITTVTAHCALGPRPTPTDEGQVSASLWRSARPRSAERQPTLRTPGSAMGTARAPTSHATANAGSVPGIPADTRRSNDHGIEAVHPPSKEANMRPSPRSTTGCCPTCGAQAQTEITLGVGDAQVLVDLRHAADDYDDYDSEGYADSI